MRRGRLRRIEGLSAREGLSFLLSAVLSTVSMMLYAGQMDDSFLFPRVAVWCAALGILPFLVCHIADRRRLAGTLVLAILFVWRFYVIRSLIGAGQRMGGVYFWQWMISGGDAEALEISADSGSLLFVAMSLAATLFFGITVYYFGAVLYRISFLVLVSLIPCVLYAKVIAEVDDRRLLLIVFANLALHLANAREKRPDGTGGIPRAGRGAFLLGFLVFSLVVLEISAVVPKRESARHYDAFEDLFLGGDTESEIAEGFSELADFSGNADNYRSISNRRLYTVYGPEEIYLKRQVFDVYDFETDRWYAFDLSGKETSADTWFAEQQSLSLAKLLRAMRAAAEADPEFAESYGIEWVTEAGAISDPVHQYYIRSQNFGASYYLSAARATGLALPDGEELCVTRQGSFYRKGGPHAPEYSYTLSVYDSPGALSEWHALGGADMDGAEARAMLAEMAQILQNAGDAEGTEAAKGAEGAENTEHTGNAEHTENTERTESTENTGDIGNTGSAGSQDANLQTALAFWGQQILADLYYARTESYAEQIPESIRQLAEEITAEASSDWEKAALLMRYFRGNGFRYDIEYRAPDDSSEYFLFEGRTGTCSDFASAYVLLARSAGLNVRYVEGFLTENSGQDNYRYVTESNSHAYAEVFLANTGWIVFDPTDGVPVVNAATGFSFWENLRVDYGLLGMIAGIAAALSVLIVSVRVLFPLAWEGIFRLRLRLSAPGNMLVPAYKRLLRRARKVGLVPRAEEVTPGELADRMAERGCDLTGLAALLEESVYGTRAVRAEDRGTLTAGYAGGMRSLRRPRGQAEQDSGSSAAF